MILKEGNLELTRNIAEYVVSIRYENLAPEVVRRTKGHILDILGVMFPPSTLEKGCIALEEIAREAGGKEESTLIGFGGKVPCWMAAFVNGSLCHPVDYDDTIDEFPNHPSSNTFPAALAVAEKVGNVSGKEFITAMAMGLDLNVRFSAGPKGGLIEDYPWMPITVFGVFSSTAAAGKLLGLTHEEMIDAFGIALDRVSGISASITSPDSEIRAIRDGFANREGVLATLMAKKGITAYKYAIEELYKVFYSNNFNPPSLSSNLGKEFMGMKVSLKPWPACRGTHTYIKAALDIVTEYNLDADNIEEVIVTVGQFGKGLCTPVEAKQKPKLSINAKLSLPFVLGLVFAKRRVVIEDFFPENLSHPKVLEIAGRVKYQYDPQLPKGMIIPSRVEVKTKSGKSFLRTEHIPYGHPENPMGDEQLIIKFKDCARYAKKRMQEEKIAYLAKQILELEKVENIKEITQMLT
jgi:2-methylcitrate dehydratase PrpD